METLEQLKAKAEEIKRRNEYWKSSKDGSYELALDVAGYYKIMKQIKEMENV